jgi:hypothetical protein
MCEDKDFAYFVDLFGAREQFTIFESMITKYGNDGFVQYYQEILANVGLPN